MMENYNRGRKQPPSVTPRSQPAGAASPRLVRSRSGGESLPEMHAAYSGSKIIGRSNSTTILRTGHEIIRKKSQKDRAGSNKTVTAAAAEMQKRASASPSAWALSPGRFLAPSSPAAVMPKSPSSKNFKVKMDGSAVSGVLKYFRQKKLCPVQQEEYHRFKIIHNRLLQWRFANARAEASIPNIKIAAQINLFDVWLRISLMRKFVADKRIKMQQLKHEIKLNKIFISQGKLLRDWGIIEARNSEAVSRLARKLSAISICLPLVDEAQADVVSMKDAITKAEEMMGNIEDLIMKMQWQVEQSCYLLAQLMPILEHEKLYMEELHKNIIMVISSKVEEESLRAHHIQQVWELRRGDASHIGC